MVEIAKETQLPCPPPSDRPDRQGSTDISSLTSDSASSASETGDATADGPGIVRSPTGDLTLPNPWIDNPTPTSKIYPDITYKLKSFANSRRVMHNSRETWPYRLHPLDQSKIFFFDFRGYGPPPEDIGNPGDIYLDHTTSLRHVMYIRDTREWICINWTADSERIEFVPYKHPLLKDRHLWGTRKAGFMWFTGNAMRRQGNYMSPSCKRDPEPMIQLALNFLFEDGCRLEARITDHALERKSAEEGRRAELQASFERKSVRDDLKGKVQKVQSRLGTALNSELKAATSMTVGRDIPNGPNMGLDDKQCIPAKRKQIVMSVCVESQRSSDGDDESPETKRQCLAPAQDTVQRHTILGGPDVPPLLSCNNRTSGERGSKDDSDNELDNDGSVESDDQRIEDDVESSGDDEESEGQIEAFEDQDIKLEDEEEEEENRGGGKKEDEVEDEDAQSGSDEGDIDGNVANEEDENIGTGDDMDVFEHEDQLEEGSRGPEGAEADDVERRVTDFATKEAATVPTLECVHPVSKKPALAQTQDSMDVDECVDDVESIIQKAADVHAFLLRNRISIEKERDALKACVEQLTDALRKEKDARLAEQQRVAHQKQECREAIVELEKAKQTVETSKKTEADLTKALQNMTMQRDEAIAERHKSDRARANAETKLAKMKDLFNAVQQTLGSS